MKNVDDLIENAADLHESGYTKGEIADELNVSRETASWLVDRQLGGERTSQTASTGPHDIHVDWSALGRDSNRLYHVAAAMADFLSKEGEDIDLTVGVEKAGLPLATIVARELDTDLSAYTPRKHRWEADDIEELKGSFSHNFADIRGRDCYIVDDTITSGTTMTETIETVREIGGEPVGCCVLVDKRGVDELSGVPVHSLIQVIRVGNDEDAPD